MVIQGMEQGKGAVFKADRGGGGFNAGNLVGEGGGRGFG